MCPNCGYCRHCGRGGGYCRPCRPIIPWPGYPRPYVGDPIGPVWVGSGVGVAVNTARAALR